MVPAIIGKMKFWRGLFFGLLSFVSGIYIYQRWEILADKFRSILSLPADSLLLLVGIIIGLIIILVLWLVPRYQVNAYRNKFINNNYDCFDAKEKPNFDREMLALENSIRGNLAQIIGGAVLLGGLYVTWLDIRVNEDGKITERYSKAIELLGSEKAEVRIGGIFALERIARDSVKDHWTVMEALCAYIQNFSKKSTNSADMISSDVQIALTVIGRRKWIEYEEKNDLRIDLKGSNLRRAELTGANLRGSNLRGADLTGAILKGADLTGASLRGADLTRADLTGAILSEINLSLADMTRANLTQADLTRAEMIRANLSGANLNKATISRADLTDVDLTKATLTEADLIRAVLSGVNLTRATLIRSNLIGTDLTGANLTGTDLTESKLDEVDLTEADLTSARMKSVDLSHVKSLERVRGLKPGSLQGQ